MTDTATPMIGRYRVLDAIGAGAMGTLVRARDERLGRDVAIKRVKNVHGLTAAIFLARFEAEARALAALSHPGVVAVYDSGVDGDEPFLVMELLAGPSLKEDLIARGPKAPAEVAAIGIQLARALEAAHARGILHRDVKPANVVRAADGTWKLIDFGVAHLPDSAVTLTGQFLGTPSYAAPEALTLGRFSPQSDVFGLAATLLEAATGTRPRGDLTLADVIARSDEPVIDDRALARLGPLAPAITAGLAIAPDRRPDASGLAALLADPARASGPLATPPPGALATPLPGTITAPLTISAPAAVSAAASLVALPEPPRRSPLRLAALGAGAVLVIGLIGLGLRCDQAAPGAGPTPGPLGAPPGRADDRPLTFAAPPGLDEKGARDWRKIAEKVAEREFGAALGKLREFERKHGATDETARLRAWLERQP